MAMATATTNVMVGGIADVINNNINMVINNHVQMINQFINSATRMLGDTVSRGSGGFITGMGMLGHGITGGITEVSKFTFSKMLEIVKDVVLTEGGVLLGIMVYKVIDQVVPCDVEPYIRTIDNMVERIDEMGLPPMKIDLPEYDFSGVIKAVRDWFNDAINGIQTALANIPEPQEPEFQFSCKPPSEQWDIGGWIDFALCSIGSALSYIASKIFYYLEMGAYYLIKALGQIAIGILEFFKWVVENIIKIAEIMANGIISLIETVANGIVNGAISLANVLFTAMFKIPAKAILEYVIKPLIILVVGVFKWAKDNLKNILCYALKVSPIVVGTVEAKRMAKKHGLLKGMLGGFLLGFTTTYFTNALLVPECSFTPDFQKSINEVQPISPPVIEEISKKITILIRGSLRYSEIPSIRVPIRYRIRIRGRLVEQELVGGKTPEKYRIYMSGSIDTSDEASGRIATTYTMYISGSITTSDEASGST